MATSTYPDNRSYFKFAQDPVGKDYAVYLSEPSMKVTFEVIGRSPNNKAGITAVINSYIRKHLCADGTLPCVVVHG